MSAKQIQAGISKSKQILDQRTYFCGKLTLTFTMFRKLWEICILAAFMAKISVVKDKIVGIHGVHIEN